MKYFFLTCAPVQDTSVNVCKTTRSGRDLSEWRNFERNVHTDTKNAELVVALMSRSRYDVDNGE